AEEAHCCAFSFACPAYSPTVDATFWAVSFTVDTASCALSLAEWRAPPEVPCWPPAPVVPCPCCPKDVPVEVVSCLPVAMLVSLPECLWVVTGHAGARPPPGRAAVAASLALFLDLLPRVLHLVADLPGRLLALVTRLVGEVLGLLGRLVDRVLHPVFRLRHACSS